MAEQLSRGLGGICLLGMHSSGKVGFDCMGGFGCMVGFDFGVTNQRVTWPVHSLYTTSKVVIYINPMYSHVLLWEVIYIAPINNGFLLGGLIYIGGYLLL
jgi:hypothetical protein